MVMPDKAPISREYLTTQDESLRWGALKEAAETRQKWRGFLKHVSIASQLAAPSLLLMGGAALLAALTGQLAISPAVGIVMLVLGAAALATAIISGRALSALKRADAVEQEDMNNKMRIRQMMQEMTANGLYVVPENTLVGGHEKKEWDQRIQTAELNEAAQRSIH